MRFGENTPSNLIFLFETIPRNDYLGWPLWVVCRAISAVEWRCGSCRRADRPYRPPVTTKTYGLDLTDTVLRDEIELVADLVVAAAGCSGRMSESQIDEALGLRGRLRHGA